MKMQSTLPIFLSLILLPFSFVSAQVDWLNASNKDIPVGARSGGTTIGNDMAVDADGDVFVTGQFSSDTQLDTVFLSDAVTGPVFLAKYNDMGEVEWALGVSGNSNNKGHCVAVNNNNEVYFAGEYTHTNSNTILDFGNITLTGNRSSSTFLAKVGDDGVPIWATRILATDAIGTQYARPVDMVLDNAGNIYVLGEMLEAATVDGQTFNANNVSQKMMFLAKFLTDGSLVWFKHTDENNQPAFVEPTKMRIGTSGDLFIHGKMGNKMYYGTDSLIAPGVGGNPYFIMRANQQGELVWWTNARANSLAQLPHDFGLDAQENTYVTYKRGGTVHFPDTSFFPADLEGRFLLVKYNSMGERQFVKDFASGEFATSGGISETSLSMTSQADGTTFISGTFGGFGSYMVFGKIDTLPMPDFVTEGFRQFIAAYDANGNYLDVGSMIDEYLSQPDMEWTGNDIHVTANGKLLLTGKYAGSLKISSDTLHSFLQQDEMYVIQLDLSNFLDLTTSLEQHDYASLDISLYPNPCSDFLQVKMEEYIPNQIQELSIFNLQGQQVIQETITSSHAKLDLSKLKTGTYFLLIQGNGKHEVIKFQKI